VTDTTTEEADDEYPYLLRTILEEFYQKPHTFARFSLTSGEIIIGHVHAPTPNSDCFSIHDADGADIWIVLSQVVTIQEWTFDEE